MADYFTVRRFTDCLSNNLQAVCKGHAYWYFLFCYVMLYIIFCRMTIECSYFSCKKEGSTLSLNLNIKSSTLFSK